MRNLRTNTPICMGIEMKATVIKTVMLTLPTTEAGDMSPYPTSPNVIILKYSASWNSIFPECGPQSPGSFSTSLLMNCTNPVVMTSKLSKMDTNVMNWFCGRRTRGICSVSQPKEKQQVVPFLPLQQRTCTASCVTAEDTTLTDRRMRSRRRTRANFMTRLNRRNATLPPVRVYVPEKYRARTGVTVTTSTMGCMLSKKRGREGAT